jgi:hypothetical protein
MGSIGHQEIFPSLFLKSFLHFITLTNAFQRKLNSSKRFSFIIIFKRFLVKQRPISIILGTERIFLICES